MNESQFHGRYIKPLEKPLYVFQHSPHLYFFTMERVGEFHGSKSKFTLIEYNLDDHKSKVLETYELSD